MGVVAFGVRGVVEEGFVCGTGDVVDVGGSVDWSLWQVGWDQARCRPTNKARLLPRGSPNWLRGSLGRCSHGILRGRLWFPLLTVLIVPTS